MLVERKKLIEHLSHVNCGGLLKDVILSGKFKATAFSVNQDLLVAVADRDGFDPLAREVGVVNLELLIKVLDIGEDEKISFDLEDRHVVLQTADRVIRLVTAAPGVIGTRADAHLVEHVMKFIPADAKWTSLGLRIVNGIQDAVSKLSAEIVVFNVTPKGTQVVIGEEAQNSIVFQFPELVGTEDYKLIFHSNLMVPVLKQITDFTKAEILLTGKGSVVPVREGGYMYVMSPAKEV